MHAIRFVVYLIGLHDDTSLTLFMFRDSVGSTEEIASYFVLFYSYTIAIPIWTGKQILATNIDDMMWLKLLQGLQILAGTVFRFDEAWRDILIRVILRMSLVHVCIPWLWKNVLSIMLIYINWKNKNNPLLLFCALSRTSRATKSSSTGILY